MVDLTGFRFREAEVFLDVDDEDRTETVVTESFAKLYEEDEIGDYRP